MPRKNCVPGSMTRPATLVFHEKNLTMTGKVRVSVAFQGIVEVSVPPHLSQEDALHAQKFALERIKATTDNPDVPDDLAFEKYESECSDLAGKTADRDWDALSTDVGGSWSVVDPPSSPVG